MRRILTAILLLAFVQGCTSDRSPIQGYGIEGPAGALAGKWQWIESCNGWSVCSDPGSTGHSGMIAFLDDALFVEYVDGQASSFGRYGITIETGSNDEEVMMLAIMGRPRRYIVDFTGDSLVLLEECIDCSVHRYSPIAE